MTDETTTPLPTAPDPDDDDGLEAFDGREVERMTVKVTNTGDGLSQAMTIDPRPFHIGDEVYVLMQTEVAGVSFKPLHADYPLGPLVCIPTLRAGTATIVDRKFAHRKLEQQRIAIERAAGVERIPGAETAGTPEPETHES
jgi:hypothetical protein